MADDISQTTTKSNTTNQSNKSNNTNKSAGIPTSSSRYDNVLWSNGVRMDTMGNKLPHAIRDLVDDVFLQGRSSPPLSDQVIESTAKKMDAWGRKTEAVMAQITSTPLFPQERPGLALGANSLWPTTALPSNPDYSYPISAPKPDYFFGYNVEMDLKAKEMNILDNPPSSEFAQPSTGIYLPWLVVEMKSEGTGGTLLHTERQAAGSGTYAVRALQWLSDEAGAVLTPKDTVAVSMAVSGRLVVLAIHWYSPEEGLYYMSKMRSFLVDRKDDVQACHDALENIVKWGLETRFGKVREVLTLLDPIPSSWSYLKAKRTEQKPGRAEDDGDDTDLVSSQRSAISGQASFSSAGSRRSSVPRSRRSSSRQSTIRPSAGRQSSQSRNSSLTHRTSVSKVSNSTKQRTKQCP